MAKSKRSRRSYRRKGRWSANIQRFVEKDVSAPGNSTFYNSTILCQNPAQNANTVSQQYTVKNIELSFQIEKNTTLGYNGIESLTTYIMYVPQGMSVTETYPFTHPEYIMAYRFLGTPDYEDGTGTEHPLRNPLKVKTRLSRRLQTGDSINLLIIGDNTGTSNLNLNFNGLVRWWTKAN